LITSYIIGINC